MNYKLVRLDVWPLRSTKKYPMSSSLNRIALLRGINVSGRNKIPMTKLRSICEGIGWKSVATCLQTGNIAFSCDEPTAPLEVSLEEAIKSQFGFSVPVIVIEGKTFESIISDSPFPEEAESDPSRVILYLCKNSLRVETQGELQKRAAEGEQVRAFSNALWIYFPNGIGRSKLTPAVIDKASGSPATGRNWKTVLKIKDLVSG
ncbi:MAG: DUF1697 domain-containing protein [Verrucomicrobiota bacterium]